VHNFFETNGLLEDLVLQNQINILEIGFGTGLNLLLLADAYLYGEAGASIKFHSIEAYPISAKTASSFNFKDHLSYPELVQKLPPLFNSLQKGYNTKQFIAGIDATIFYGLFEDYDADNIQFDFVFHDAFSPKVNPELWTKNTFVKLKSMSARNCILTTYSAASKAKGAMAAAGWKLAKAPGALGKREMTVASLNPEKLAEFERVDEVRLARRYEEDDF